MSVPRELIAQGISHTPKENISGGSATDNGYDDNAGFRDLAESQPRI